MYLRVHISYAMRSSALAQNNPQVVHLILHGCGEILSFIAIQWSLLIAFETALFCDMSSQNAGF